VETGTGVPAIQRLLQGLDVHMAAVLLEQDIERSTHARRRARWERRLAWLRALVDQHVRAEHLVLTEFPVLPAALRVDPGPGGLDAGYRRVLEANASGEPLALQDAVDALFGLASPND
jgi:DNA-directed RNA polymerase beta' subunit